MKCVCGFQNAIYLLRTQWKYKCYLAYSNQVQPSFPHSPPLFWILINMKSRLQSNQVMFFLYNLLALNLLRTKWKLNNSKYIDNIQNIISYRHFINRLHSIVTLLSIQFTTQFNLWIIIKKIRKKIILPAPNLYGVEILLMKIGTLLRLSTMIETNGWSTTKDISSRTVFKLNVTTWLMVATAAVVPRSSMLNMLCWMMSSTFSSTCSLSAKNGRRQRSLNKFTMPI